MNLYEAANQAHIEAERFNERAQRERLAAEKRPRYVPPTMDRWADRQQGALARAVASYKSLETIPPGRQVLQRASTPPARQPITALAGSRPDEIVSRAAARGITRCRRWTYKCSTPGCTYNAAWTRNGIHACNVHYRALENAR